MFETVKSWVRNRRRAPAVVEESGLLGGRIRPGSDHETGEVEGNQSLNCSTVRPLVHHLGSDEIDDGVRVDYTFATR